MILTPEIMKVGGKYNWQYQKERLVCLGVKRGWHQFALVQQPSVVWCEVRGTDLHMLEETVQA